METNWGQTERFPVFQQMEIGQCPVCAGFFLSDFLCRSHAWHSLFLNIIRVKFTIAVELNNHGSFLRRNEVRYAGRDDDETACGVPFQITDVEFRSLAQIPGSFDDSDQFVLRVDMRTDTFAGWHLDAIDPRTALT